MGPAPCKGLALSAKIIFCGMRLPMQAGLHGGGVCENHAHVKPMTSKGAILEICISKCTATLGNSATAKQLEARVYTAHNGLIRNAEHLRELQEVHCPALPESFPGFVVQDQQATYSCFYNRMLQLLFKKGKCV